jgi:hypothetical protein
VNSLNFTIYHTYLTFYFVFKTGSHNSIPSKLIRSARQNYTDSSNGQLCSANRVALSSLFVTSRSSLKTINSRKSLTLGDSGLLPPMKGSLIVGVNCDAIFFSTGVTQEADATVDAWVLFKYIFSGDLLVKLVI